MALRAVLYPRVSTKMQVDDGWSVSAQLAAMRTYCNNNNLQVVREVTEDLGKSATSLSGRDGMQALIEASALTPRPFDVVLIWALDRSFRNVIEGLTTFKLFEERGVELRSLNENFDNTSSGNMLKAISLAVAEHESRRKSERIRLGLTEAARSGSWSHQPPIGYRVVRVEVEGRVKRKLELDDKYSPVVKEIFEQILNGRGIQTIATELNARGLITPKGNRWSTDTIAKILRNPVYCGDTLSGTRTRIFGSKKRRKGDEILTHDTHTGIVSREIFTRVREVIKNRTVKEIHPKSVGSRFLLSGYTYCQCGSRLAGRSSISKKYSYYYCSGRSKRKTNCTFKDFRADKLEQAILDKLTEVILEPEIIADLVRLSNDAIESDDSANRITALEAELKKHRAKVERLVDAIADGDGDIPEIKNRIKNEKERITKLERELYVLVGEQARKPAPINEADVARYIVDLRGVLESTDQEQRKSLLRGFIESVSIALPRITIEFKLPAAKSRQQVLSLTDTRISG